MCKPNAVVTIAKWIQMVVVYGIGFLILFLVLDYLPPSDASHRFSGTKGTPKLGPHPLFGPPFCARAFHLWKNWRKKIEHKKKHEVLIPSGKQTVRY
jgi:hypothetical protein